MIPESLLLTSVALSLSPMALWVILVLEHWMSETDGNKMKFLRYDGEFKTIFELKDKAVWLTLVLLETMKSMVVVAPDPIVSPLA